LNQLPVGAVLNPHAVVNLAAAAQHAGNAPVVAQQTSRVVLPPQQTERPGPYTPGVIRVTKDQLPAPQRVGRGAVEMPQIIVIEEPKPKPPPPERGQGKGGKKKSKAAARADQPQPTAVSVMGMAKEVTWQDLKTHMSPAGNIQVVVMVKDEDGEPSGKACVKFSHKAEAAKAIDLFAGSQFRGEILVVEQWVGPLPQGAQSASSMASWDGGDWGESPWNPMMAMMGMMMGSMMAAQRMQSPRGDPDKMVYVGNLNPSISWQDLQNHMKSVGTVEYTNKRKESGQVHFSTAEEAQKAIQELNGSTLKDCKITVDKWT